MNPQIVYPALILLVYITLIGSVVLLIVRKYKKKSMKYFVVSLAASIFLFVILNLFITSHPTHYKYNDGDILGSNIYAVQHKYGDFDHGSIEDHKAGRVAYYIYTENSIPDPVKHYYYIEYDEWGVVDKVYDAPQLVSYKEIRSTKNGD